MQNNRLCVEEPFNTERNLGNTADDTSFRGIHLELRRAFDLVKDARLAECMEQYNFPSTEEKVWEKPPPKPVPVLTRSRSQSQSSRGNRGGAGHRGGGRHGPGHRAGQPARRASSAAAMNKFAASQVGLQGVRGREFPPREHHLQEQYDQLRLHHHLFNRFQFLQAQEHELRLLQAQAQLQAQVEAAHGLGNGSSVSQQALTDISMNTQIPLTAPLGSGQHFHPFAYPQVPGTPQQIVHTQPSSPAMKPVQPDLRRSLHRSSAADSAYASNPRSHSQPARPLPFSLALQNAPPMPLNSTGYLQYQQQLRQQQQNPYRAMEAGQGGYRPAETLYTQDPRRLSIDPPIEESVPKEYVGYWVNDSPPSRPHRVDSMASRSPAYQDVHPRVRGVPQSVTRLRDTSRSPSPSPTLPFRDRSFSNQSASSAPPGPLQARIDRVPAVMPGPRTSGPVIINGSDGWMMPDYSMTADASSHTTTLSEATSGSDDQFYETPTTAEIETPGQGHNFDDGFSNLEDRKHYFHAQMTVESPFTMSSYNNGYADSTKQRINGPPTEIPPYHNTTRRPNQGNRPAGGLGIQFGEHEVSAKTERRPPPEAGRAPVASSNAESHPEQNNARAEAFLMPIPLLSPVREVRTPSPSATRRREMKEADAPRSNKRLGGKMDLYIPSFADLVRARQEKQTGALEQQPNGFTSSHPAGSARSIESVRTPRTNQQPESSKTQPQVNCWQQPGKKSRKIKTRPNLGQLITGEPLPVDEAERKGG